MKQSSFGSDWFEVSDRDWLPKLKPKQLRLLADAQVPEPIVNEIRNAGICIDTLAGAVVSC